MIKLVSIPFDFSNTFLFLMHNKGCNLPYQFKIIELVIDYTKAIRLNKQLGGDIYGNKQQQ